MIKEDLKVGDMLIASSTYRTSVHRIVRDTKAYWVLDDDSYIRKDTLSLRGGGYGFGSAYYRVPKEGEVDKIVITNKFYSLLDDVKCRGSKDWVINKDSLELLERLSSDYKAKAAK